MIFCQSVLGALAVIGWTYRLMQRSVLKQWWKASAASTHGDRFESFAAVETGNIWNSADHDVYGTFDPIYDRLFVYQFRNFGNTFGASVSITGNGTSVQITFNGVKLQSAPWRWSRWPRS